MGLSTHEGELKVAKKALKKENVEMQIRFSKAEVELHNLGKNET